MALIKRVGKATVHIQVDGCIDCGTKYSRGWEMSKTVPIKIGNKSYNAEIYRCADCIERRNHNGKKPHSVK